MSFYSVYATVSARAQSIDAAKQTLESYMVIFQDEDTFAFYGGSQIYDTGKIDIPLGMVVRLTDNEVSIIKSLGPLENYRNYGEYLEEVFASRLDEEGGDPDDVFEFIREKFVGSVVDVFAEIGINSFSVDCNIAASGNVYNGQSVKLPGDVRILEDFEWVKLESGSFWSLRSHEKIVTADASLGEYCTFEFDGINDLLWSSLDEAGRPSDRVIYHSIGPAPEKQHYGMSVHLGLDVLRINFEFLAPENKGLRGKKKLRIFATVEFDSAQIWSGDDPTALKLMLNEWCAKRQI